MVESSRIARYTAEFVGTFLLAFVVGCTTITDKYVWGPTACAATLAALVYMFGDVSGGHFNPAVSIAAFISQRMTLDDLAIYSLVQVLGAMFATMCYNLLFWHNFNIGPHPGVTWLQAGVAELIYTAMLCFVVLNTAYATRKQFTGLAIGFVLIAGGYGAGAVSGGCFNPALALAIDVSSARVGFGWSICYIGFQLMGTALASVFYRLCRPYEFGKTDSLIRAEPGLGQEVRISMLIAEMLGTFILTVTVGLNVVGNSKATAWSAGAALTCMIYALGDISGGHFNPAVTVATMLSGRWTSGVTSPMKGAMYIVVQFIAGLIGAWTFAGLGGWKTFSLGPLAHYSWATRAPVLIFFTAVLCLTVLCVATVKVTQVLDEYFGLIIGLCIVIGGPVVGMASGGTMNPAVTFGVATTGLLCNGCTPVIWGIFYIVFEFLGGALAAGLFILTHPEEYKGDLKLPSSTSLRYEEPMVRRVPYEEVTVTRVPYEEVKSTRYIEPRTMGPTYQTVITETPPTVTGSVRVISAGEFVEPAYVELQGTRIPIYTDYQLQAMDPSQRRDHASLLQRLVGATAPSNDTSLVSWILEVQRTRLLA